MLPPLVTLEDFETRLKPRVLDEDEEARATAALQDVSTMIREKSRQSWMDDAGMPVAPDILQTIAFAAAKRVFNNPDGHSSETSTEGPYTHAVTYAAGTSGVWLTPQELEIVERYRPRRQSPLWTLSTTRRDCEENTVYGYDQYHCDPIALYADGDLRGDCYPC